MLARRQQWMQTVLSNAQSLDSGLGDAEEIESGSLQSLVAPSSKLNSFQRLEIYRRSYYARLIECFRSLFPALRQALGERLFESFAIDYLQRYPPTSYTLEDLANAFPQHLRNTRPEAKGADTTWPDFIIELAELEQRCLKIYDAEGTEGKQTPDRRNVLDLSDIQLLECAPAPASVFHLFQSNYPVHNYIAQVRKDEDAGIPLPRQTYLAITRRRFRVHFHELSETQYLFAKRLDGRTTLQKNLKEGQSLNEIREWLGSFCQWGFFSSL